MATEGSINSDIVSSFINEEKLNGSYQNQNSEVYQTTTAQIKGTKF